MDEWRAAAPRARARATCRSAPRARGRAVHSATRDVSSQRATFRGTHGRTRRPPGAPPRRSRHERGRRGARRRRGPCRRGGAPTLRLLAVGRRRRAARAPHHPIDGTPLGNPAHAADAARRSPHAIGGAARAFGPEHVDLSRAVRAVRSARWPSEFSRASWAASPPRCRRPPAAVGCRRRASELARLQRHSELAEVWSQLDEVAGRRAAAPCATPTTPRSIARIVDAVCAAPATAAALPTAARQHRCAAQPPPAALATRRREKITNPSSTVAAARRPPRYPAPRHRPARRQQNGASLPTRSGASPPSRCPRTLRVPPAAGRSTLPSSSGTLRCTLARVWTRSTNSSATARSARLRCVIGLCRCCSTATCTSRRRSSSSS